jgi:hypothetical protein
MRLIADVGIAGVAVALSLEVATALHASDRIFAQRAYFRGEFFLSLMGIDDVHDGIVVTLEEPRRIADLDRSQGVIEHALLAPLDCPRPRLPLFLRRTDLLLDFIISPTLVQGVQGYKKDTH